MARPKVVVTGIGRVDRKLRELGAKKANAIARKALREAARPMNAAVKEWEPRGETGALKRGVKTRAGRRSQKRISLWVVVSDREFPEKYYAAFTEFGTRKMTADHAMKNAYDQTRGYSRRIIIRFIKQGIAAATK